MDVELVGAGALQRRQDNRQVLGQAAGEDRVDRHLLDSALDQVGRDHRHHLMGIAGGPREHPEHPLGRRWHHRQAVAPTPRIGGFELVLGGAEDDPAGDQPAAVEACRQPLRHPRLDGQRATAGPVLGEAVAEPADARQLFPLRPQPALQRADHLAIPHPEQRRHDLDALAIGPLQVGVVDRVGTLREGRVVQEGTPADLWHRPAEAFVTRFVQAQRGAQPPREAT